MNSHFFSPCCDYSTLLTLPNASKIFWSWISICHIQVHKEKEFCDCLHVYVLHKTWNQAFSPGSRAVTVKKCTKKASCTCKVVVLPCQGALTICMENPVIPGRIQMERFILVEIFRKKSNTLRGITFFPFLLIRPKYLVPFVWSVPGVSWGGKWFVSTQAHSLSGVLQWYNSNSFLFSETFSSPVPFVRNVLPKFRYKW